MRDKILVVFDGEERKFKKIKDVIQEYKDLNLQYHEIQELIKYFDKNGERQRKHERFKFLTSKIKINKIVN